MIREETVCIMPLHTGKGRTESKAISGSMEDREGRIPFDISLNQPNKETMAAMLEAERIAHDPSVKHYSDVEEALQELKR